MKQLITVFLGVFFVSSVFAQNKGYTFYYSAERSIEPVYRISETPAIIDTTIPIPSINYPLLSFHRETSFSLDTIKAAKIKLTEKLPRLYHSYVRVGFGNYLTPLGEVFINSTRSRKFHWGVQATHLSSWGKIKGYAPATFDNTQTSAYGKILEKNYTLSGKVNYGNQGLHFYGIQRENVPKDSIRQRFNDVGFTTQFDWHKKDTAHLNYTLGLNYNHYNDRKISDSLKKWRAQENYLAVTSSWKYKLKQEIFAADLNLRYNGYKYGVPNNFLSHAYDTLNSKLDTGIVNNNYLIDFKPNVTTFGKNGKWSVLIGLDLFFDVHKNEKVKVVPVPMVAFHYSLFHDIFIPYVGINGGVQQNTFKSLSQTNNFISSNVQMKNEYNTINFYGGIRGVISKSISFDANISFGHYQNKLMFAIDSVYSGGNRYRPVYDNMNITKLEASISYQLNEKIKIDAVGQYFSYQTRKYPYAWNLPDFKFMLRGHYNMFEKFYFNVDFNLQTGRKGMVYGPGADVKQENGYYYKKLGVLADANLGVEYAYNKRISAFIQCNNLAAQKYKRWVNYQVQAFQIIGGVTFKF